MPHSRQPPIFTVPVATTVPTVRSTGSLHVSALSPLRAAGSELIRTVLLPTLIVPLLVGGLWKLVPGGVGICGGMLSAVLPVVAAPRPIILTLLLRLPLMIPENGWGSGVGTGGVPGTITTWVSVAKIRSPCFAAGCPMR